jgi:hypothetical protein
MFLISVGIPLFSQKLGDVIRIPGIRAEKCWQPNTYAEETQIIHLHCNIFWALNISITLGGNIV